MFFNKIRETVNALRPLDDNHPVMIKTKLENTSTLENEAKEDTIEIGKPDMVERIFIFTLSSIFSIFLYSLNKIFPAMVSQITDIKFWEALLTTVGMGFIVILYSQFVKHTNSYLAIGNKLRETILALKGDYE
jgi:hypothetical protein